MCNFRSLNISKELISSLDNMGLKTMTPIQAKSIPVTLKGKDIIGCAQTGTGKTIAFLIPVIEKILQFNNKQALILAPTRELASQIQNVVKQLLKNIHNVSSVLIIGGAPIFKQIQKLKQNTNIIVGTPGRVTDHLKRKSLNLGHLGLLVIDESDRMLDMGFSTQLDYILKQLPTQKQTLMFSATFSSTILSLSKKYLQNPEKIKIESSTKISTKIKEEVIQTSNSSKYDDLINALNTREGSIIVFINTKAHAEILSKKLLKNKFSVSTLHGDIFHRKREKVIKNFREKNSRIMIATDIASRGLDIPHVQHVINYDLPMSHEDYIHRIGRTGRADNTGHALNFVGPGECGRWNRMQKLINPSHSILKNKNNKFKYTKSFSTTKRKNKTIKTYKKITK